VTLKEKTQKAIELARQLHAIDLNQPDAYAQTRALAMRLKKHLQNIASTARAFELRTCAHDMLEQPHIYTEVTADGVRRRIQYFRCARCGKGAVKKVDVTDSEVA
jgi:hypothetical protein